MGRGSHSEHKVLGKTPEHTNPSGYPLLAENPKEQL